MRFDVLTLFPEIFSGYLGQSLLKKAIDAGLVHVHLHNLRDWAKGKHHPGGRPPLRRRSRHGDDGRAGRGGRRRDPRAGSDGRPMWCC